MPLPSVPTPRQLLFEELRSRQAKNPRYSLRAFAKFLEIPPGRLSQYLSGKRDVTPPVTKKICERLAVSPGIEAKLIARHQAAKAGYPADEEFQLLSDDEFHLLADWVHFAILSLIRIKNESHRTVDLARRLGVTPTVVEQALARLMKSELIVQRRGRYSRTAGRLRSTDGVASRALRASHQQNLAQAIDALDSVPIELRSVTSITMPIAIRKISAAKERIKAFRREMSELLDGEDGDEVYNLNIQLVPVTKMEKTK